MCTYIICILTLRMNEIFYSCHVDVLIFRLI